MNNLYRHSKGHEKNIVTPFFVSFVSLESAVIDGVLSVLFIIELTTDSGKSFDEANLLMMLISDGNLSVEQIQKHVQQGF